MVLCDSAHNLDGIAKLLDGISQVSFETLHIVFGTVQDKDPSLVLSMLPKSAKYYFAKANIPRGLDAGVLEKKGKALGLKGQSYPSVKKAYQSALKNAGEMDFVLITGSIFVVAEIL